MTNPISPIAEFMRLGGQTVPNNVEKNINPQELIGFHDRIHEELTETAEASTHHPYNIPETLDGFIDIAYAALTGAIRIAGENKAAQAWDAVVDANLAKVDGRHGAPIIDKTGKIRKPAGWTAPDIAGIVNKNNDH